MIRVFINGLAASAGGGLTYLRNVIPVLGRREGVAVTILVAPELRREFGEVPNICFVEGLESSRAGRRFFFEQTKLASLVRNSGAQVLISTGNFAAVPKLALYFQRFCP
jgi:hypothetical protein